jgi:hypothetical protein
MAQTSHPHEGALAREALAHAGAHVTHDHEPGTMDITRQEETFSTFMRFVTRMAVIIVVILIFLAIING